MNEGLKRNSRLLKQAKKLGYRGKKRSTPVLENWLAANKKKKSSTKKKSSSAAAADKPLTAAERKRKAAARRAARRRKASGRSLVRQAHNRVKSHKKTPKRGARPSLATDARRLARRLDTVDKDLAVAIRKMANKKDGKGKARKNPAMHPALGGGLGFVGGLAIEAGLAGGLRKIEKLSVGNMAKAVEIGVPVLGCAATWWAHKKGMGPLSEPAVAYGLIGGMIAGAVVRNVPQISSKLAGIPVIGALVSFGQEKGSAFGEYYAGAAGMGRYLTSGAVGNLDYADDLYAGQAGVGRYMLDDTAFGMGSTHDLRAGAAGVGRYVSEPPALDGLSGVHQDDLDELMDDLGAVPHLTPDEEQAENILIPELAYEALQGLHGGLGADPKATLRARSMAPIVRTTPGVANKLREYNIGEIIGESQQVPGTILVATSVAGRDINQGAGAMIPTQRGAFKNPGIQPAGKVSTEPYGVFSRGIFSSTLPVHGQISR